MKRSVFHLCQSVSLKGFVLESSAAYSCDCADCKKLNIYSVAQKTQVDG